MVECKFTCMQIHAPSVGRVNTLNSTLSLAALVVNISKECGRSWKMIDKNILIAINSALLGDILHLLIDHNRNIIEKSCSFDFNTITTKKLCNDGNQVKREMQRIKQLNSKHHHNYSFSLFASLNSN